MAFYLILCSAIVGAILLVLFIVWGVLRVCGRRPRRYWRRVAWSQVLIVPLVVLVLVPGYFAWYLSRRTHTRTDESAWSGPALNEENAWIVQKRGGVFARGQTGFRGRLVEPSRVTTSDGLSVRYFDVPASGSPSGPRVTAVLVHGLFRGGLELDPVAMMFRQQGCRTVVMEMRNHGRSDRCPATFGLQESEDVLAVVGAVSAEFDARDRLVVFGVSMGAAAAALAAPRIPELDALILDAPMDDLEATAHRVIEFRLGLPWPLRQSFITALEWWSDFDMASVRPIESVAHLSSELPVLVIGGSEDTRMPPEVVRAVYEAVPSPAGVKQLWVREGSDHGKVWVDAPAEYERRIAGLLARVREN